MAKAEEGLILQGQDPNVLPQASSQRRWIPTADRLEQGKALRKRVARKEHSVWVAPQDRSDPIAVLEASNRGRITNLIPIRYGRMSKTAFSFYRGSAALMARDLASTPVSGIEAQICGDCHLMNFGAYATPERNLIVDINDFDETTHGPWEWDLKRLASSFVLACRENSFSADSCREAAEAAAHSYRTAMKQFTEMTVQEVWYSKMNLEDYLSSISDKDIRQHASKRVKKELSRGSNDYYFPKFTVQKDGSYRFKENPPVFYHSSKQLEPGHADLIRYFLDNYKSTMTEARRYLFDRYTYVDVAMKVVGIGSVGTFCGVVLLMAEENDSLILQIKQAGASVLEPYVGKSKYSHPGQRVVEGQRLMQSHSDIFLGWSTGLDKRHYYVRQLKDHKMPPNPDMWTPARAVEVARAFGWILARAHARSSDPALISGYIGASDAFDQALVSFAVSYADQTEKDHRRLLEAIKSGRIQARIE